MSLFHKTPLRSLSTAAAWNFLGAQNCAPLLHIPWKPFSPRLVIRSTELSFWGLKSRVCLRYLDHKNIVWSFYSRAGSWDSEYQKRSAICVVALGILCRRPHACLLTFCLQPCINRLYLHSTLLESTYSELLWKVLLIFQKNQKSLKL